MYTQDVTKTKVKRMDIEIKKGDKVKLIYLGQHYILAITEFADLELRKL
jgi:hypothetical protein